MNETTMNDLLDDTYFTYNEAARALGVGWNRLERMIVSGELATIDLLGEKRVLAAGKRGLRYVFRKRQLIQRQCPTIKAFCEEHGVTRRTVNNWEKQGKVKIERVGRYSYVITNKQQAREILDTAADAAEVKDYWEQNYWKHKGKGAYPSKQDETQGEEA